MKHLTLVVLLITLFSCKKELSEPSPIESIKSEAAGAFVQLTPNGDHNNFIYNFIKTMKADPVRGDNSPVLNATGDIWVGIGCSLMANLQYKNWQAWTSQINIINRGISTSRFVDQQPYLRPIVSDLSPDGIVWYIGAENEYSWAYAANPLNKAPSTTIIPTFNKMFNSLVAQNPGVKMAIISMMYNPTLSQQGYVWKDYPVVGKGDWDVARINAAAQKKVVEYNAKGGRAIYIDIVNETTLWNPARPYKALFIPENAPGVPTGLGGTHFEQVGYDIWAKKIIPILKAFK